MVGESMSRPIPVVDRTFAGFQHTQLEQGDHITFYLNVIGCGISHGRALKALQFARRVMDAAIADDCCFDRFDRRRTQCLTAVKALAHFG